MGDKRSSRDEVLGWMAREGRGCKAAAKHFNIPLGTVKSWRSRYGLPGAAPPESGVAPPAQPSRKPRKKRSSGGSGADSSSGQPASRTRGAAPAEELDPEDRGVALRFVRDCRFLGEAHLAKLRRQVEAGEDVVYDARQAQAVLNYQRAAKEVLETHPGLLKLVEGADGGVGRARSIAGPDAAERLRRALGGAGPDDEG